MTALRRAATAVETVSTGTWVGASAGFAFIFAPVAFHLITDRNVFAELTERSLGRLATLTLYAAGVSGVTAFTRAGLERSGRWNDVLRGLTAAGVIGAIRYHQNAVVPAMISAQTAMGGFDDVAEDDPRRVAYRALHKRSTRVYGTALFLGIAHLLLAATRSNDDGPRRINAAC